MSEKTPVTLIQGKDTQVRRVRIGDIELKVQHAGPVMMGGQMAVTMTILDVDVRGEVEDTEQTPAISAGSEPDPASAA